MKSSLNHNPRRSNIANTNTVSRPIPTPKITLLRRRGSKDLKISTLPGTEPGAQSCRPAPRDCNSTTLNLTTSIDTKLSLEIDYPIKPSHIVQVEVNEITNEIEPEVNMPVYILPHDFISSTIPAMSPANTTPPVENQIHTKPSEASKVREDIKVKEITKEYMDKVLEEMARVEHDEESGGVESGNVKSLYEELFELKRNSWGWGSPPLPFVHKPVNHRNDGPRGGQVFMECREEIRMRMEAKKRAEAAKAKENLERAALAEAAEKQRADALKKDTSGVVQAEDGDSLSVEASDKMEKWKWVFYTGDKGGEIRTKIPISPRGTPIHYD